MCVLRHYFQVQRYAFSAYNACFLLIIYHLLTIFLYLCRAKCDSSSVGRALASQAKGRGFEPRLSLWKMADMN